MQKQTEIDPIITRILGQLFANLPDGYAYLISMDKDLDSKLKGNTIFLKGDHNYLGGNEKGDGWKFENAGTKEYCVIHFFDSDGKEEINVKR